MKTTHVTSRTAKLWIFSALITTTLMLANPNTTAGQPDAPPAKAKPVSVTKVTGELALFNTITVTVANLPELVKAASNDYSKIILYVDGYQFKGITPRPGDTTDELKFDLRRSEANKTSWDSLLGKPKLPIPRMKPVAVTIGLDGQLPSMPGFKYQMTVLDPIWYWVYLGALLLSLGFFVRWARNSDVLRIGPALANGSLQPYSLGRCQMAFWFCLVAASYVFIWMVTSDYGVLPGSVLALIGISAATSLGAVLIDNNSPTPAIPVVPQPSRGFFHDVCSDDKGKLTFDRFQIFVWSIVLGIIFVASVYNVLTMPDFPGQLLALMGISSGTYLGFKFPEKQP